MNKKGIIRWGALSGLLAVGLGAFGAHGLKELLTNNQTLDTWETASQYHLIHSVAILLPWSMPPARWYPALWFLAGIVLFSGSLYILALTNQKWLGMVTPLGGLCFLAGWLALFLAPEQKQAGNT